MTWASDFLSDVMTTKYQEENQGTEVYYWYYFSALEHGLNGVRVEIGQASCRIEHWLLSACVWDYPHVSERYAF